ncbi:hypothetical protein lerEdw1_011165 [Lerista edwardsae]|nr:hypothetical protein lerEdw1_011165 [Lerista edwardsae]
MFLGVGTNVPHKVHHASLLGWLWSCPSLAISVLEANGSVTPSWLRETPVFSQTFDKMKTELERTCDGVVRIYQQYAILDPIDDYLHFKEFKKLMEEQAQFFLKDTTPFRTTEDTYLQKLFDDADQEKTGYLKFSEFLSVLNLIQIDAHNRSHNLGEEGSAF